MNRVGGIVLCGGAGRRMGRPKAELPFGGEMLLRRIVRIVSTVVQPVVVARRRGQTVPELPAGVLVVEDAVEDAGPLAGIAAGFAALADTCEAAFVCSCDHPLLVPQFVRALIAFLGDAPGVVPSHEGREHPLLAVYRLETAAVVAEMLAAGQHRAQDFARRCGARVVPAADLCEAAPDLHSMLNVNDPEAYQGALRLLSGRGTASP